MTNSELELWNRIKAFQFDKPDVQLTFAKRLARENRISENFANEIIDEYRKFLFLCCVSREPVSPSPLVDQAWHLHLNYTRSYWTDLCGNTLGRSLHHDPTEGGAAEDKKFKVLYLRTLQLYESYFSSPAPDDIWPSRDAGPETNEIEKGGFWTFSKPAFSFGRRKNRASLLALILASLLFGCSASASSGLLILIILLVLGVVIYLIWRHNRNSTGYGGSGCGSAGCGGGGSHDNSDGSDGGDGGGSGCSSGCSGGCGGGGD